MPVTAPVLVYDRIDANRRKTRLLFAVFALLAGPALLSAGGFVLVPVIAVVGTMLLSLTFLINPYAGEAQVLVWALAVVCASIALTAAAIVTATRQNPSRLLLRLAKARGVGPQECPTLVHVVEELSIAAGLPTPAVAVIDSPVPNAFAVGRDPTAATIAVTRGLLELMDRRSLAAVIGHELAHVGNHDTRLAGVVAVMTAVLAWPILWPFGLTRSSLGLVRQAGRLALLAVALIVFFSMLLCAWTVISMGDPEVAATRLQFPAWWFLLMFLPTVAPMYGLVVAPLAAFRLRSRVSTGREFLADAQAALITRDPGGLALALRTLRDGAGDIPWAASASHLFIANPFGRRPPLWQRWFPTHPPLDVRIARLEEMFPSLHAQQAESAGTPVLRVPPQGAGPHTSPVVMGDPGTAPDALDEPPGRQHLLRRTTQASRRSMSWQDLPTTSLLRVLALTSLGALMCLSPLSFFTGLPLVAYGAWPLFSLIGERRLVGFCPSCNAPLDTGSRGRASSVTCSACHRRVFIEGDTFVEGDVSTVASEPSTEVPAQPAATPDRAVLSHNRNLDAVPVYRDPDGWSPVVTRVAARARLRPIPGADIGNFVAVAIEGGRGYVSRAADVTFEPVEPNERDPAV
ncbi:MAG: M48 family metalloprotease [Bacteroidales bacterium]